MGVGELWLVCKMSKNLKKDNTPTDMPIDYSGLGNPSIETPFSGDFRLCQVDRVNEDSLCIVLCPQTCQLSPVSFNSISSNPKDSLNPNLRQPFNLCLLSPWTSAYLGNFEKNLWVCLFVCLFLFFKTEFLCSFGACPGTRSCRPGFPQNHRDPPASASQVLGLKACTATHHLENL